MRNNIVLIGMTGSGKSTIGKLLSDALGYSFVDMDAYIEEKSGKSIPELFQINEDYFRSLETTACKEMSDYTNTVISTGGGAVIKQENREALREAGLIFWLDRPVNQIVEDISTEGRPLLSAGKERIYTLYEERNELYKSTADFVIKNNTSIEDSIDQLVNRIKNRKKRSD